MKKDMINYFPGTEDKMRLYIKKIDDETFNKAVTKYGNQGVTELTAAIGYYGMLACALNVFEVSPEPGKPTLI